MKKRVEAVNIVKYFRYHGGLYEENEPSPELAANIDMKVNTIKKYESGEIYPASVAFS
ncbi:MAG: hypothetical protein U5K79_07940 [Cyclobacteriaceae bacterium]|nr:hypothetical protein [Cyclobacteriaceae bacterium]